MDFYCSEMILKFANSFPMTQLCLRTYFDDMLLFQLAKPNTNKEVCHNCVKTNPCLMETLNRKKKMFSFI